MNKCECYEEREVIDDYSFNFDRRLIGICNGTKERDRCLCSGNPVKCDFYPEIREKARRQTQEYRDTKELEFYRTWIEEHQLKNLVERNFEEWFNENC